MLPSEPFQLEIFEFFNESFRIDLSNFLTKLNRTSQFNMRPQIDPSGPELVNGQNKFDPDVGNVWGPSQMINLI